MAFGPIAPPRLPGSRFRQTELGRECCCSQCGEWWPADREFFFIGPRGNPHSWCKACYVEKRAQAGTRPNHGTRTLRGLPRDDPMRVQRDSVVYPFRYISHFAVAMD